MVNTGRGKGLQQITRVFSLQFCHHLVISSKSKENTRKWYGYLISKSCFKIEMGCLGVIYRSFCKAYFLILLKIRLYRMTCIFTSRYPIPILKHDLKEGIHTTFSYFSYFVKQNCKESSLVICCKTLLSFLP